MKRYAFGLVLLGLLILASDSTHGAACQNCNPMLTVSENRSVYVLTVRKVEDKWKAFCSNGTEAPFLHVKAGDQIAWILDGDAEEDNISITFVGPVRKLFVENVRKITVTKEPGYAYTVAVDADSDPTGKCGAGNGKKHEYAIGEKGTIPPPNIIVCPPTGCP